MINPKMHHKPRDVCGQRTKCLQNYAIVLFFLSFFIRSSIFNSDFVEDPAFERMVPYFSSVFQHKFSIVIFKRLSSWLYEPVLKNTRILSRICFIIITVKRWNDVCFFIHSIILKMNEPVNRWRFDPLRSVSIQEECERG